MGRRAAEKPGPISGGQAGSVHASRPGRWRPPHRWRFSPAVRRGGAVAAPSPRLTEVRAASGADDQDRLHTPPPSPGAKLATATGTSLTFSEVLTPWPRDHARRATGLDSRSVATRTTPTTLVAAVGKKQVKLNCWVVLNPTSRATGSTRDQRSKLVTRCSTFSPVAPSL